MKTKLSISAIFLAMLTLFAMTSCERIDAGYEGVLVKQYGTDKGVQDITLVTGTVWYNPLTEDVREVPLYVKTVDYDCKRQGRVTVHR